jgi:hypothetical protein
MTPKEKAIDLVKDMEFEIPYVHDPTEPQADDIAKKCALIAVEAILFSNNTIFETNIPHECWKYWIEVKQEMQLL